MRGTLADRLYSRLEEDEATGCLLWTRSKDRDGYGRIYVAGYPRYVHRVAWELDNGPIPEGMEIDHVKARGCINRHCGNVAHLELVTHRENTLRGNTITAACAAATHCPHSHPYDETNTYRRPDGTRECRTCMRGRRRLVSATP